ncbi:hypothetical protein V2I01_35065 [Micromonospora sp. BRA006-A]|nr:hypothetical protein [Micromonospora sp. BRA006-A]
MTFEKTWQANQGYFEQARHADRRRQPAGPVPDRRQLPGRVRRPQHHARPEQLPRLRRARRVEVPQEPAGVRRGRRQARRVAAGENTQGLVYNKTLLTRNGCRADHR